MFSSIKRLLISLAALLILCFHASPLTIGQEAGLQPSSVELLNPNAGAIERGEFFSLDSLDESTKRLSEELLLKALDGEAFYTLVGQLKPVSEGFWGGYFSVDSLDLTEVERIRTAVRAWNEPDLFYADVLVYETIQNGQRYASAYVVHIPSLKKLIVDKKEFFGRWGITADTPPSEIMMAIERSQQPDDRWRGFGLVFGYPEYAIDFFVAAGMHQRTTGEFIERDFRQIPTFSSKTGRFVYAVPKIGRVEQIDTELKRKATLILMEYKRMRPQYTEPEKNPVALLRDWMDDGKGNCHPKNLLSKLPVKSDAEIDAEIDAMEKEK